MFKPRIGHVHIKVRNLERAIQFYTRTLNFKVTERIGNTYAFLSGGEAHHELALQNVGMDSRMAHPGSVGLYHIAFEVSDRQSLSEAYANLKEANVSFSAVDHQISWALYFSDPDGNGVEIYWDTRKEAGGRLLWEGFSSQLDPKALLTN